MFASFLYLSSSRLLITSIYILLPVKVYYQGSDGSTPLATKHCVYEDPTLVYFSTRHTGFALLAIIMLFLFFILPVFLLSAYPFFCFQRILNKIGLNSLVLHTFIDVFQGYYKDGTNGTRDYRYFSIFPFLFPLVCYITFAVTESSFLYNLVSFFGLLYIAILLVLQPFKQIKHNFITACMLFSLVLGSWSMIINNTFSTSAEYFSMSMILFTVSQSIPYIYVLCLTCFLMKRVLCS